MVFLFYDSSADVDRDLFEAMSFGHNLPGLQVTYNAPKAIAMRVHADRPAVLVAEDGCVLVDVRGMDEPQLQLMPLYQTRYLESTDPPSLRVITGAAGDKIVPGDLRAHMARLEWKEEGPLPGAEFFLEEDRDYSIFYP